MIITLDPRYGYRASLAGYLDKCAPTREEAIALMLAQVAYWNSITR